MHRLIFGNIGDNNGFLFKTGCDDSEEKIKQINDDFSVNDLILICNVLCICDSEFVHEIAARVISCFCELSWNQI